MNASPKTRAPHPDRPLSTRATLAVAACLSSLLALGVGLGTFAQAPPDPGAFDPAAVARQLPPLAAEGGSVALPLDGEAPFQWLDISGGSGVTHPDGRLHARYTIASGRPAGAALIIRPGTLAGLSALEIEIEGNRSTRLVPTLRDVDGVVYRLPALPVEAGRARTHRLSAEEMSFFRGQSAVADPGRFDPSGAVLLSLVDISGFTGAAAPGTEVEWTISQLDAHVAGGQEAAPATPPHRPAPASTEPPSTQRHPIAEQAEARFFEIFNGRAGRIGEDVTRGAALPDLMTAYAVDSADARTNLWLGLNHLWLAAEGDRTDPRVIENLILSEHFLARAEALDPSDRRIPSWLVPGRQALARIHGDAEAATALEADLLAAYAEDPDFHSVSVAMAGYRSPRGSEAFTRGLEALRRSDATCPDDDPTCGNHPRWPHNVEGFLLLTADYELKAGNPEAARAVYEKIRTVPTYADWPYREELEDRLARFALYTDLFTNEDPGDDPPNLLIGTQDACQACHRAG